MTSLVVIAGVIGNILSVVGVVICNKYIVEKDGYNFMVFLSALHFIATYTGMMVLLKFKFFEFKVASFSGVLPLAMGSLLSVAFMNLNLSHNSVGFYQLSKLACIPCTLLIQYLAYTQMASRMVLLTLLPITIGVGYATVYDLDINVFGSILATLAVLFTSIAQIFTNTYQKSLDCDALQLLYHTSPIIAVGMLAMSPFFDDIPSLIAYEYSSGCVFRILASCCFAIGVNVTNYIVIGKTSPLTYQVLGHFKTILILILGFLMFNKIIDMRNILGIVIAMGGVIWYTEVKRVEGSKPATVVSGSSNESASRLLGEDKEDSKA